MNLTSAVSTLAFRGIGGYVFGYIYGAYYNINKTLSAQAFAIMNLTYATFEVLSTLLLHNHPKALLATLTLGTVVLGTAHIVAFRQLNLIATLGTCFIAGCLFLRTISLLSALTDSDLPPQPAV